MDWDYIDRMRAALPADLIEGRGVPMHHREFVAKFEAKKNYLGEDTLALRLAAEFNALSDAEKSEIEKKPGKFGIFSLADTKEVDLALTVVAQEHFTEYKFNEYEIRDLTDPETVAKISERFPDITPERIALALEPAMA